MDGKFIFFLLILGEMCWEIYRIDWGIFLYVVKFWCLFLNFYYVVIRKGGCEREGGIWVGGFLCKGEEFC